MKTSSKHLHLGRLGFISRDRFIKGGKRYGLILHFRWLPGGRRHLQISMWRWGFEKRYWPPGTSVLFAEHLRT